MPKKVIENYINFVKQISVTQISLLSYDKYDSESTLNLELLNDFFNKELKTEWKEDLIKEYGRKTLYLTSR